MRSFLVIVSIVAAMAGPEISVSPSQVAPGDSFTISGVGFDPDGRVKISWDGATLAGTTKIGPDGTFRYSGTVPQDASPGSHIIEAVAVGAGNASAATALNVGTALTTTTTQPTTTTTAQSPATTSGQTAVPPVGSANSPATTAATIPSTSTTGLAESGESTPTSSFPITPTAAEMRDEPAGLEGRAVAGDGPA